MLENHSPGIQYGTSLGSCGRNRGNTEKVHIRHINRTLPRTASQNQDPLKSCKMASTPVLKASKSIVVYKMIEMFRDGGEEKDRRRKTGNKD